MASRTFGTMRARSAVAVLTLLGTTAALVAAADSASAAASADLSLTQTVSGSAVSGHAGDTIAIHNAGPDAASTISVVLYVKTQSNTFSIGISGAPCQFVPPAPTFQFTLTCQSPSLANGGTLNLVTEVAGQVGVKFTLRASVGEGGPGDPTFANNTSVLASWFGPRADLALTEAAPPQSTPGTARTVSTVVNHGPNTSTSLNLLIEANSPTFNSVGASTNQPGAVCAFTTPEAGYNVAVLCSLGSLATGATWVETLDWVGTSDKRVWTKTTIGAGSPVDPVNSNNSHTLRQKYA